MNKQRITIIGGGTAGWITASILAKGLPASHFDVTLIESPDIPTVGVGEATIPPIVQLVQFLEINEKEFIQAIQATYKYGIHFQDWHQVGSAYMHAFGNVGNDFDDYSFTEMWMDYKDSLALPPLNAFSPCALAAYNGRFSHPVLAPKDANPNFFYPLSELFHAYQFDASLLAAYLKEYAIDKGITFIADTVKTVEQKANGNISHVVLSSGEQVESDFFVDCSGARSLLNKQTLNVDFEDWGHYLPCDRALAVQTESSEEPFPYTKSFAMSAGWRWQIPLRNRNGNGYVYSSRHISDEDAKEELLSSLDGQTLITEPRVLKFKTGCLKQPWCKNSIAIGLSSGFFEPLESTSIHMIHKYALKFRGALLHGTNLDEEINVFNQAYHDDALSIRDFLILHYCTSRRRDSQFWLDCQAQEQPKTLTSYLRSYEATGQIDLPETALFPYQSWLQVLTGQGFAFGRADKQSKPTMSEQDAANYFRNIQHALKQEVARLPSHQSYIDELSR